MTHSPHDFADDSTSRSRLARGLLSTIPIVLVGSMAIGLNVTGPLQSVDNRKDKPKASPSELGKNIREAFTAAARASKNPVGLAETSPAKTAVAASVPATYTVQAGDTVSGIAGHYGLATASVLALNGLGWKSTIFAGQQLKLSNGGPVSVAPKTAPTASSRYTITTGDTIGGIAARFGVSTQTLLSANGLGWASIIYPGHTLAIPGTSSTAGIASSQTPIVETATPVRANPVRAKQYTITTGDNASSIASKFGVPVEALLAANGLTGSNLLYAGRSLTIPSLTPLVPTSALTVVPLTSTMATNAKTIVAVGRSLGVPDYGLVVALAAAAQESGLLNLDYGDRDSLGLFQQRPSTGWGSPAQIMTTSYAARLFFGGPSNPNKGNSRGLLDIPGWQSKSVTQAAQAVQLSGFPTAYAKWETSARHWLASIR